MLVQISDMNLSIKLDKPRWQNIFTIPKGTVLEKGRRGLYRDITGAAGKVNERFGCYAWCGETAVYYCGSFAKDYAHGSHKSNMQGRVHNYLQNHRLQENGRKNTNLMVFDNINVSLKYESISFRQLQLNSLHIGSDVITFSEFSNNPDAVKAVEQLLICTFRRLGQCEWNRG